MEIDSVDRKGAISADTMVSYWERIWAARSDNLMASSRALKLAYQWVDTMVSSRAVERVDLTA